MTSLNNPHCSLISRRREGGRRARAATASALATFTLAGTLLGVGCKEEPPPPPPPRRVVEDPPPPPPKPGELVLEVLPADSRVKADNTVVSEADKAEVIAALRFADAFARGDTAALEQMLDTESIRVLRDLDSEQLWSDQVEDIDSITLVNVSGTGSGDDFNVMFMLGLADGESLPMTWAATRRGDMYIFEPKVEVPAIRAPEDDDDDAEGDDDASSDGGNTRSNPPSGNPRDPRRNIPRQDPRGPGQDPG